MAKISMILTELKAGESARITAIDGGEGLVRQLSLRGFIPGRTLRIISNTRGPVLVEMKEGTIALGRGMARKIVVERGS